MNTSSARQVAAIAGTTAPRVLRAAAGLGYAGPGTGKGGKRRFTADQVARLVERLRSVAPTGPVVPGLRPSEVRVLAALAHAPLGLTSARAVSRAAGVSPATASSALTSLRARGLVVIEKRILAEDRARERQLYTIDVEDRAWPTLAAALQTTRRPGADSPARAEQTTEGQRVPRRLAHVFWNEDLAMLDLDRNGPLIARRILQAKDPQALAWAVTHLLARDWERTAEARGLDRRDVALAGILARSTGPSAASGAQDTVTLGTSS